MKDSINSSTSELQLDLVKEVDNSQLNASEIVEKNTSFIELKSQSDFSINANTSKNSQAFDLRDLFWVGVLSLLLGFAIAYMLIRSSKRPTFTKAAVEEDLQDESNTFQTNLSISNDIETQELDLVRTYIEMDDWESATKILDKLIANSTNDLIVSEAYSLLKEKK
jgi:FimV-like protein